MAYENDFNVRLKTGVNRPFHLDIRRGIGAHGIQGNSHGTFPGRTSAKTAHGKPVQDAVQHAASILEPSHSEVLLRHVPCKNRSLSIRDAAVWLLRNRGIPSHSGR